jgi:hypothetical protein
MRRGFGPPDPDMRVSDAERAEITDRLSKHYSDGRLDESEFHERLDRAMSAKTQSDLHGLLADLPEPDAAKNGPGPRPRPRPQRAGLARILFLALVIVIAAAVGQALLHAYLLWILAAAVIFLWLRFGRRHR